MTQKDNLFRMSKMTSKCRQYYNCINYQFLTNIGSYDKKINVKKKGYRKG